MERTNVSSKRYAEKIAKKKQKHKNNKNYRHNLLVNTFGHEQADWVVTLNKPRGSSQNIVGLAELLKSIPDFCAKEGPVRNHCESKTEVYCVAFLLSPL